MTVTIGIDVGGTKIAGGAVDAEGRILSRSQVPTPAGDPPATVAGIVKVARELRAAAPGAVACGIGAAGVIDHDRGVVLTAPNLAWRNLHLRAMAEDRIGIPVALDNDANVAAYGEALFGAGRGLGDQVMITVGTGIGGGIVIGGAIYRGAHGVGAEVGHMIVDARGPECPCGARGCLEAVASGSAIGRLARERLAGGEGGEEVLSRAGGDIGAVTGEVVGGAAVAGDPFAVSILAETGRWLGIGLASLTNLLDPAVFVIGGGAASGTGDLLIAPARDSMAACVIGREFRHLPDVVAAALGADAGVVGAAAVAREGQRASRGS